MLLQFAYRFAPIFETVRWLEIKLIIIIQISKGCPTKWAAFASYFSGPDGA